VRAKEIITYLRSTFQNQRIDREQQPSLIPSSAPRPSNYPPLPPQPRNNYLTSMPTAQPSHLSTSSCIVSPQSHQQQQSYQNLPVQRQHHDQQQQQQQQQQNAQASGGPPVGGVQVVTVCHLFIAHLNRSRIFLEHCLMHNNKFLQLLMVLRILRRPDLSHTSLTIALSPNLDKVIFQVK
jgi:hypothetical protein